MKAKEFKEKYLKKEAHNKFAVVQMLPKGNNYHVHEDEEIDNIKEAGFFPYS